MNLAMNRSRNICVGQQGVMIYIYVFFPRPSGHVLITHSVLWYTKFIKTYILFFYLLCISPCLCLPPPSHHPLFLCMCVCLSVEVRSHFLETVPIFYHVGSGSQTPSLGNKHLIHRAISVTLNMSYYFYHKCHNHPGLILTYHLYKEWRL